MSDDPRFKKLKALALKAGTLALDSELPSTSIP
jgi:hypothetical protein